jgi:N-succinyldiaminopimelate aminotransferase
VRPISLGLGEPQHPTPQLIKDAVVANLDGLSRYPATTGMAELRQAITRWLVKRHGLEALDADKQVIPCSGSKEAVFSVAQAILDPDDKNAIVVLPNPFYQIYEGATLLGGAKPHYVNALARNGLRPDWESIPEDVWKRTRLVFVCSPNNPTGRVMTREEWRLLFERSDRHGFVIVSDECYSELYFDESSPPLGALRAAQDLGRREYTNLVVLGSLSKRSSAPGVRSGYAAGDRKILERYTVYRTYEGAALSNTMQAASIAAWNDEAHVAENRRMYREKFATFFERVNPVLPLTWPDAGFYYWVAIPGGDDLAFTRDLFERTHITVLPGSYISRESNGEVPGRGFVRMALVSTVQEASEAADRIAAFAKEWTARLSGTKVLENLDGRR